MSQIAEQDLLAKLREYRNPLINVDMVANKYVKSLKCKETNVNIALKLGFPCERSKTELAEQIATFIQKTYPELEVNVDISWKVEPHQSQGDTKAITGVKNIIAVASGKGGVGKSTTAVNLALALKQEGANVGILDADIYGPSQPIMLGGMGERPVAVAKNAINPVVRHGIQSMSIGYLVDEGQAAVWRGPMVSGALLQLLNDTQWQDLDYLIIDMPPGTGDIQLTLAQKVPVTGSVIVTTPQDIALADARKGISMFEKVSIPVIGIVENMAVHVCKNCGHEEHIFGQGGGKTLADEQGVEVLGSLPLDINIREQVDGGLPSSIALPDGAVAKAYRQIALKMTSRLANQAKDYVAAFPTMVVSAE